MSQKHRMYKSGLETKADFVAQVQRVLEELEKIEEEVKRTKESDRTLAHRYRKVIEKFFFNNGVL